MLFRDKNLKKIIRDIVRRNARYDFIFYLPIEFPLVDDGLRSMDPVFQKNIDQRFKQRLRNWRIGYITLRGSPEKRLTEALKHISKKMKV